MENNNNHTSSSPQRGSGFGDHHHHNPTMTSHEADSVSAMSDENVSVASKLSIWTQTKMILMGQNPNAILEEENDGAVEDDKVVGLSVPGGKFEKVLDNIGTITTTSVVGGENNNNAASPLSDGGQSILTTTPTTPQHRGVSWKNPIENDDDTRLQQLYKSNASYESSTELFLDFMHDDPREMTWSRRIALFLAKRYSWYNPGLNNKKTQYSPIASSSATNSNSSVPTNGQATTTTTKADGDIVGKEDEDDYVEQVLTKSNKKELLLNDAYPFTKSTPQHPSLEIAWAYFEHVALPRHIQQPKDRTKKKKNIVHRAVRKVFMKGNKQLQRAETGEREVPTVLYDPIFTPHKQLGDFGLGIGLYFSTLRAITVWTFLAGVLNTVNLKYFNSSEYNDPNNFNVMNATLKLLVKGSAICTDTSWVICTDCSNHTNQLSDRVSTTAYNIDTGINTTLVLRNNCDGATIEQGMVSYATLLFIMIGTIVLSIYLTRMEIVYDEDEQTAQDYSIIVKNPPPDATNPQEWYDFFKNAFNVHVTACTVAVDNDLLVRTLVARREILRKIEFAVEPGTSLDTLTIARLAAKEERERRFVARVMSYIVPSIPEYFAQLTVMNAKVQGLAQLSYPATSVFISFETEHAQRTVLETYNLGSIDIRNNNTTKIKDPTKHLFRNELILRLSEPDEPNTVRWQDLNVTFKERLKQQLFTMFCTIAAIVLIAFIVYIINGLNLGTQATAYTIAVFNVAFPEFAKFLTNFEAHSSESDKQRSLYSKIALFRWVNTAVVITIITPFTATLTNQTGLIDQIAALFYADLTTTNAIQLLDPLGHLQRHLLAPRARNQDAMNLCMQGAVYELAERYTNMTKILFLALWYCSIFPGALYLCSFSLLVMYFCDRFSIMRTWKRAPQLGAKISQFSRRFFFPISIIAMAITSSYYWASFPFDNVCNTGIVVDSNSTGTYNITVPDPKTDIDKQVPQLIQISDTDTIHTFCIQDFLRFPKGETPFPFVPRNQIIGQEWMTNEQEIVTNIYGWSAIGVMALIVLTFVYKWYNDCMSMFHGTYEPCGEDMNINFSDVPSMSSYVPQVNSHIFSYPLLASNIDNIDTNLLDWTDPDRKHSFYDLTKDAEVLLRGKEFGNNVVFSQIAHWPPPGKEKKSRKNKNSNNDIDNDNNNMSNNSTSNNNNGRNEERLEL